MITVSDNPVTVFDLQLGRYFDIEGRNTYLTAELRAGFVAFLTVRVPEATASFVPGCTATAQCPTAQC